MRKIRKVMLLIIVFAIALIMKENTVYAESTIQVIPDKSAWTSITVSDAYDVCQKLNKNYSTLGTESLKAHLTTNADWYAVSLLTYSTYGNRDASNTTGNKTGIINFGSKYTYTSALMEGSTTNDNIKSLYDNINTPYVESVKNGTNRSSNEPGRGLLSMEFLSGSFGTDWYSTQKGYPVCVRNSLFGFNIGSNNGSASGDNRSGSTGASTSSVTFRPVIWNK